jgi:hypothetical protein
MLTREGLSRLLNKGKEGTWKTWYNGDEIQHLPWAPSRPYAYNDGDGSNCLMQESEITFSGDPHHSIETTVVYDEECRLPFFPLCLIEKEVRKMTIRGLCTETGYNKSYLFNITDEGSLLYGGDHMSNIYYTLVWRWYGWMDNFI